MSRGDEVEVFLDGPSEWVAGYELAGVQDSAAGLSFQVRRQVDGALLGDELGADCIRPANSGPESTPDDRDDED